MTRFASLLILLPLLLAAPAIAQVPRTMSYQGVLTNASGVPVPDGLYDVTFRIYDVPAAGVAMWTEAHTGGSQVATYRGGFSVILGSINPLSLAFDGQLYLGIQLGANPELTPRIPLASSPYAMGLRLPFTLSAVAGTGLLQGYEFGGLGVALDAFSPGGGYTWAFEPDASGSGGFLYATRDGSSAAFYLDGNSGASGDPTLGLTGASRSVIMDMNVAGNASVSLPSSAISAAEILDEPGIAQGHALGSVNVSIGAMADIVTVTLTTSAAGYIVVEADGQHGLNGDAAAAYNYASLQIDETAGGAVDGDHYFVSGFTSGPRNFFTWTPISIRRTYFKAAGTYTFRLEATGTQAAVLQNYLWNPTITAQFFPTSYGGVTTAPPVADAGQFMERRLTSSVGNGPGQPAVQGELVDLRELELRAAKAEADAERAHRELLEARVGVQARAREAAKAAARVEK